MLWAEAVTISVEFGTAVAALTGLGGAIATGLVAAAKLLVRYLECKDTEHAKSYAMLAGETKEIADRFASDTRSARQEAQQTNRQLLEIQEKTIETVTETNLAIHALTARVEHLEKPRGRREG